MIVEILIAQCQSVHPLGDHLGHRVPCAPWTPPVQETLRQPRQKLQSPVGLAKQQPARIRADRTAVELRRHLARKMGLESEAALGTLCHSESRLSLASNCCVETQLCQSRRLFARGLVRNAG